MSKYTTTLFNVMQSETGLYTIDGNNFADIVDASVNKIFGEVNRRITTSDFLVEFERLFLRRFALHEICVETVNQWENLLYVKMLVTYPIYSEKYELLNTKYDITNEFTKNKSGRSADSSANEETHKTETIRNSLTKSSDTPQGSLSGLADNRYLSSAEQTDDKNTAETTDKKTDTKSNTYTEEENGHNVTITALISERMELLQSVYEEWLADCEELFMSLW